jgi:hypothetical protein
MTSKRFFNFQLEFHSEVMLFGSTRIEKLKVLELTRVWKVGISNNSSLGRIWEQKSLSSRNCSSISEKNLKLRSPLERYRTMVSNGTLKEDQSQLEAIKRLEILQDRLKSHKIRPSNDETKENRSEIPTGLYLYGGVGSGKTMIMDIFYQSCDTISQKRRVHFDGKYSLCF